MEYIRQIDSPNTYTKYDQIRLQNGDSVISVMSIMQKVFKA